MAKKGTTKYKSNLQEKSVAKQFGGKQVIASGALWFAHSDVRNDKFLIECKTTQEDSYSVTSKVWEKVQEEAIRDHMRIPLLVVDLKDKERFVVFRPNDFEGGVPEPYVSTYNGTDIDNPPKSYRITLDNLKEAEDMCGEYVYGQLFIICGKRRNMLFYMRDKDFQEAFKEEL